MKNTENKVHSFMHKFLTTQIIFNNLRKLKGSELGQENKKRERKIRWRLIKSQLLAVSKDGFTKN